MYSCRLIVLFICSLYLSVVNGDSTTSSCCYNQKFVPVTWWGYGGEPTYPEDLTVQKERTKQAIEEQDMLKLEVMGLEDLPYAESEEEVIRIVDDAFHGYSVYGAYYFAPSLRRLRRRLGTEPSCVSERTNFQGWVFKPSDSWDFAHEFPTSNAIQLAADLASFPTNYWMADLETNPIGATLLPKEYRNLVVRVGKSLPYTDFYPRGDPFPPVQECQNDLTYGQDMLLGSLSGLNMIVILADSSTLKIWQQWGKDMVIGNPAICSPSSPCQIAVNIDTGFLKADTGYAIRKFFEANGLVDNISNCDLCEEKVSQFANTNNQTDTRTGDDDVDAGDDETGATGAAGAVRQSGRTLAAVATMVCLLTAML